MRASLEKNPRLTPLSIGRSDASGDDGLKAEGRPYNEQRGDQAQSSRLALLGRAKTALPMRPDRNRTHLKLERGAKLKSTFGAFLRCN
jgi:hypothetical protein